MLSCLPALNPAFLARAAPEMARAAGQGAQLQAALGQGDDLDIYCFQEPPQRPISPPSIPLIPSLSFPFPTHSVLSSERNSQPLYFSKTHIPPAELTSYDTNIKLCRSIHPIL